LRHLLSKIQAGDHYWQNSQNFILCPVCYVKLLKRGVQSPQRTPLISPESPIVFTLHLTQSFTIDGLPVWRAWLIESVDRQTNYTMTRMNYSLIGTAALILSCS
jgi:hypothetical protein